MNRDRVEIDEDVKAVVSFMQASIAASKLVRVAAEVGRLAPLLWDHYEQTEVRSVRIVPEPISAQRTESSANG